MIVTRMRATVLAAILVLLTLSSNLLAHDGGYHELDLHEVYLYEYTAQGWSGCYLHKWYDHYDWVHHYDKHGYFIIEDSPQYSGQHDHVTWVGFTC